MLNFRVFLLYQFSRFLTRQGSHYEKAFKDFLRLFRGFGGSQKRFRLITVSSRGEMGRDWAQDSFLERSGAPSGQ